MSMCIIKAVLFAGAALIFIESSSTKLAHDTKLGEKTDKEIKEKRQCSGFPIGLSYDSDLVIGWANRWENQCPDGDASIYILCVNAVIGYFYVFISPCSKVVVLPRKRPK